MICNSNEKLAVSVSLYLKTQTVCIRLVSPHSTRWESFSIALFWPSSRLPLILGSLCAHSAVIHSLFGSAGHRGSKPDNGFVISGQLNCATVSLTGSNVELPTVLRSQTGQAGHAGWIGSANCLVCVTSANRGGAGFFLWMKNKTRLRNVFVFHCMSAHFNHCVAS